MNGRFRIMDGRCRIMDGRCRIMDGRCTTCGGDGVHVAPRVAGVLSTTCVGTVCVILRIAG